MLRWLAFALLLPAGAHAAPALRTPMPLASGFDLTSVMAKPAIGLGGHAHPSRWLMTEIEPPPGAPHDPPLLRVRGKKVKMRLSF